DALAAFLAVLPDRAYPVDGDLGFVDADRLDHADPRALLIHQKNARIEQEIAEPVDNPVRAQPSHSLSELLATVNIEPVLRGGPVATEHGIAAAEIEIAAFHLGRIGDRIHAPGLFALRVHFRAILLRGHE